MITEKIWLLVSETLTLVPALYIISHINDQLSCLCSITLPCLILCNPLDCSPPGSSVHGIFQARILGQIAISYSRGSSQPRDWAHVSSISRQILYYRATWEAHFIHSSVYTSIPIPKSSHSPFAPWCPYVCSLCLCLYYYFANRLICTTFLDLLSLQPNLKANYAIQ